MLKPRFHLLVGLLITLVFNSPAQTSEIVCPGSWKQGPSVPPPRFYHALAFEPRGPHGHVLLFGGSDTQSNRQGDGVRWTQVATTGPAARDATAMAYDKTRGKVVLFAGEVHGVIQQDTWEWTGPIYGCSNRAAGDLNCDREVDREDLTVVVSALGLPACGAADPRDLNQDGKINAQDAQLLVNHCTTLGCQ
jgi:hypothetical protein